jgi:hypothetical protein
MTQESKNSGESWTKMEQGAQSLCFWSIIFLVLVELFFAAGLLSPAVSFVGNEIDILTAMLAIGTASLSLAVLYLAFRLGNDKRP